MLGKAGINFNEPTRVTELLLVLLRAFELFEGDKKLNAGALFPGFWLLSLTM
jgi:hypothetical protein